MAFRVAAGAANAGTLTPDIPERMVLIAMLPVGVPPTPWEAHILFIHLGSGTWISCDTALSISSDALANEDIVPLARNSVYPLDRGAVWAFPIISEDRLAALRARATQLSEVLGGPTGSSVTHGDGVWYFSDTAHASFGHPLPVSVLSTLTAADIRSGTAGAIGLVRADEGLGDGLQWTHIERIAPTDFAEWVREKREGAGRDRRVLALEAATSGGASLFSDVLGAMQRETGPSLVSTGPPTLASLSQLSAVQPFKKPDAYRRVFGDTSPVLPELLLGLSDSGKEMLPFISDFFVHSGLSPRSGVGLEIFYLLVSLYYLCCWDRCDPTSLIAAEHIARRLVQLQKAVRRNPKQPDFNSLESMMRHCDPIHGTIHTPALDKALSETAKAEANVMKNIRMMEEEKVKNNKEEHPKKKGDK